MGDLATRLRTGANHFEAEGDMGMPILLREAATAVEDRDRLRAALEAARNCIGGYISDLIDEGFPGVACDVIVIRDAADAALEASRAGDA